MSELVRGAGNEPLIMVGVHLLTPPLREIFALLVRAGIMVVEE